MKYEFKLTDQMIEDRKNCSEDSFCSGECSCHLGEDECVFNFLRAYEDNNMRKRERTANEKWRCEMKKIEELGYISDTNIYAIGEIARKVDELVRAFNVLSEIANPDFKQGIELKDTLNDRN